MVSQEGVGYMFSKLKSIIAPEHVPEPVAEAPPEPKVEFPAVEPFKDMMIETGIAGSVPDHKKPFIDHVGHMRVVARNNEEIKKIGADALSSSRFKKTVMYGEDNISGYISGEGLLRFMTLTKNGDVFATYPLCNAGKPRMVRLLDITECENGYEGQLQAFAGGATLSFYDTLYFRNKGRYSPGKEFEAVIGGVAYVLTRAKSSGVKGDPEMAIHYENGDADDYIFRGVAQEVVEATVLGKKVQVIRTTLQAGFDAMPAEMYLCATENAIPERIHKGDHISGIIWLQGFIVD